MSPQPFPSLVGLVRVTFGVFACVETAVGRLSKAATYSATVELIQCQVCHLAVDEVIDNRTHPDNFLHIDRSEWSQEDTIDEYVKALCDETKKVEGALWRQLDLVPGKPGGEHLVEVVDKRPQMQWCGDECHTASKACFEVLEEHGEAMTEAILDGSKREDVHAATCSRPCEAKRRQKGPKGYEFHDQAFRPLTDAARKEVDKALGMLRFSQKTGAFGPGDLDRRMDEIRRNAYGDVNDDPWEGGGWGEDALEKEAEEKGKQAIREARREKKRKKQKKRRREERQKRKLAAGKEL